MSKTIFVGIDPGLSNAACVAFCDDELIYEAHHKSKPVKDAPKTLPIQRLYDMAEGIINGFMDGLSSLPINAEFPNIVDVVVGVEEPFIGKSARSSLLVYGVYVLVLNCLALRNWAPLQVIQLPAPSVKKFMGVTKKSMIAREVFRRWQYEGKTEDLCDAYAIARLAQHKHNEQQATQVTT